MNTITDLQGHFLRVYGALEDEEARKPTSGRSVTGLMPPTSQIRQYQCRAGMANASQCDLFHLGQMTRFFAMRAKSIFLGSNLIDPDFASEDLGDTDIRDDGREVTVPVPQGPPSDITTILASMKQFPDYQIDNNHQSCGVRRRLLPVLFCLDRYLLDPRALLGINSKSWDDPSDRRRMQWANGMKSQTIDIRFSSILAIRFPTGRSRSATPDTAAEDAVLLFNAKKRNWEA